MIYGLALLLLLFGIVMGIPALRQLLRMRKINRNAASTTGYVENMGNALGWLWTSNFGSVTRPNIKYQSPQGKEMAIGVASSSMFTFHRYEAGMMVQVVYDRSSPWDAYAQPEWKANLRDLGIGLAGLGLAGVLTLVGRILGL